MTIVNTLLQDQDQAYYLPYTSSNGGSLSDNSFDPKVGSLPGGTGTGAAPFVFPLEGDLSFLLSTNSYSYADVDNDGPLSSFTGEHEYNLIPIDDDDDDKYKSYTSTPPSCPSLSPGSTIFEDLLVEEKIGLGMDRHLGGDMDMGMGMNMGMNVGMSMEMDMSMDMGMGRLFPSLPGSAQMGYPQLPRPPVTRQQQQQQQQQQPQQSQQTQQRKPYTGPARGLMGRSTSRALIRPNATTNSIQLNPSHPTHPTDHSTRPTRPNPSPAENASYHSSSSLKGTERGTEIWTSLDWDRLLNLHQAGSAVGREGLGLGPVNAGASADVGVEGGNQPTRPGLVLSSPMVQVQREVESYIVPHQTYGAFLFDHQAGYNFDLPLVSHHEGQEREHNDVDADGDVDVDAREMEGRAVGDDESRTYQPGPTPSPILSSFTESGLSPVPFIQLTEPTMASITGFSTTTTTGTTGSINNSNPVSEPTTRGKKRSAMDELELPGQGKGKGKKFIRPPSDRGQGRKPSPRVGGKDDGFSPSPSNSTPAHAHGEEETEPLAQKKARRREINRKSARTLREKRKAELEGAWAVVEDLKREVKGLREEVRSGREWRFGVMAELIKRGIDLSSLNTLDGPTPYSGPSDSHAPGTRAGTATREEEEMDRDVSDTDQSDYEP